MDKIERRQQLWRSCGQQLQTAGASLMLLGIGGPVAVTAYRFAGGVHLLQPAWRDIAALPFEMIGAGWFLGGCMAAPLCMGIAGVKATQALKLKFSR